MHRFTYSYGHKSRLAAELALEGFFSAGEVSPGENPEIDSYKTKDNKRRYRIQIDG